MKTAVALTFVASVLALVGCCSTPHDTRWEYKVTLVPKAPELVNPMHDTKTMTSAELPALMNEYQAKQRAHVQSFLDSLGKDGWVLVSEDNGTFYLKRPLK